MRWKPQGRKIESLGDLGRVFVMDYLTFPPSMRPMLYETVRGLFRLVNDARGPERWIDYSASGRAYHGPKTQVTAAARRSVDSIQDILYSMREAQPVGSTSDIRASSVWLVSQACKMTGLGVPDNQQPTDGTLFGIGVISAEGDTGNAFIGIWGDERTRQPHLGAVSPIDSRGEPDIIVRGTQREHAIADVAARTIQLFTSGPPALG